MDTRARKIWFLRRLNLFAAMAPEEVEEIAGHLYERVCHRREMVLDPSRENERIYLVKSGSVRLYRLSDDGREFTTAIMRAGQMFGTAALLGRGTDNTFAEALEEAYVCEATAEEFVRIMSTHPLLAAKVTVAIARQLLHMEQQLDRIAFQEVPERLAQTLIQLGEEGTLDVPIRATHEELAKLAGTTRETATKFLNEFAEAGLIELGYRRVTIKDAEGLRHLASSEQTG